MSEQQNKEKRMERVFDSRDHEESGGDRGVVWQEGRITDLSSGMVVRDDSSTEGSSLSSGRKESNSLLT